MTLTLSPRCRFNQANPVTRTERSVLTACKIFQQQILWQRQQQTPLLFLFKTADLKLSSIT